MKILSRLILIFHDEAGVPGFPSDEDIASIKRRYHNSVAWVDFQVKEFVEELKKSGSL